MSILDKFSLKGRIALVSGGAGPLFGSSISEALAEAEATVITASRSTERNSEYADHMCGKGYDVHGLTLDISDPESIDALRSEVTERFGRVDVLVNNAVVGRGGGFDDQTPDYWVQSAQGNMVGLFAMCHVSHDNTYISSPFSLPRIVFFTFSSLSKPLLSLA